ncbi:MAG: hypothetical protein LBT58_00815 [Endomicrobium sp.]|jgi:hypothetical protein|nr:hypothetical protein [Endomicrobium sp.]
MNIKKILSLAVVLALLCLPMKGICQESQKISVSGAVAGGITASTLVIIFFENLPI